MTVVRLTVTSVIYRYFTQTSKSSTEAFHETNTNTHCPAVSETQCRLAKWCDNLFLTLTECLEKVVNDTGVPSTIFSDICMYIPAGKHRKPFMIIIIGAETELMI